MNTTSHFDLRSFLRRMEAQAPHVEPMPDEAPRAALIVLPAQLVIAAYGGAVTMRAWRHVCGDVYQTMRGRLLRKAVIDLRGAPPLRIRASDLDDGIGLLGLGDDSRVSVVVPDTWDQRGLYSAAGLQRKLLWFGAGDLRRAFAYLGHAIPPFLKEAGQ
jgi:hypothetical protein